MDRMTDKEREELAARISEFASDARKIVEHANEAAEHLKRGDFKAVAEVIGISHYKIGAASSDRDGIMKFLSEHGIEPGTD